MIYISSYKINHILDFCPQFEFRELIKNSIINRKIIHQISRRNIILLLMTQDKSDLYVQIVPFTNADHKIITESNKNPLQRIKVDNTTTLCAISKYVLRQANGIDEGHLKVTLHAPYKSKCIQLPLTMTFSDFLLITSQDRQGEIRYRFDKIHDSKPKVQTTRRNIPTSIQSLTYNNCTPQQSIYPYQFPTNLNSALPPMNLTPSQERATGFQYHQPTQPSFQPSFDFIQKMNKTLHNVEPHYNMTENYAKPLKKTKKKPPPQEPPPPPPPPQMQQPNQYEMPNFTNSIGMDSVNSLFHTGFQLYSNSFGSFPHIDSMSIGHVQNDSEKAPPSTESISLKKDLEQILRK